MGGSACLTIGGGVVSDLFKPEQRGLAMSVFSFGPLFGPVLGPICGAFIAQGAGWRWVSIIASTSTFIERALTRIDLLGTCYRGWYLHRIRDRLQSRDKPSHLDGAQDTEATKRTRAT